MQKLSILQEFQDDLYFTYVSGERPNKHIHNANVFCNFQMQLNSSNLNHLQSLHRAKRLTIYYSNSKANLIMSMDYTCAVVFFR